MGDKIKLIHLLCLIFLCPFCKQSEYEIKNQIKLHSEIVDKKDNILSIKSTLSIQDNEVEEHGHCWSKFIEEPNIETSEFTCLGPLKNTKEFSENLEFEEGVIFIRAYLIVNSYIVYGETITVTLR